MVATTNKLTTTTVQRYTPIHHLVMLASYVIVHLSQLVKLILLESLEQVNVVVEVQAVRVAV